MSRGSNQYNRRTFLREGVSRLLADALHGLQGLQGLRAGGDDRRRMRPLRPPGAIAEAAFVDTCLRCGACAAVCPAHAIHLMPPGDSPTAGTPFVQPYLAACVVCEGLLCTHECPSGALLPLSSPDQINMGLARVIDSACTRSHGDDCTICVDRCPIGSAALQLCDDGPPVVLEAGCVGCGVCEQFCPTEPRAIVVDAPMN